MGELWRGTFQTTSYPRLLWVLPVVRGRMEVLLSPRLEEGGTALLTYSGFYLRGKSLRFPLALRRCASVTFEGTHAATKQELSLEVHEAGPDALRGVYRTFRPIDEGEFNLRRA